MECVDNPSPPLPLLTFSLGTPSLSIPSSTTSSNHKTINDQKSSISLPPFFQTSLATTQPHPTSTSPPKPLPSTHPLPDAAACIPSGSQRHICMSSALASSHPGASGDLCYSLLQLTLLKLTLQLTKSPGHPARRDEGRGRESKGLGSPALQCTRKPKESSGQRKPHLPTTAETNPPPAN